MNITLNLAERKLAEYLAKCRYTQARENGRVDQKVGKQSNWQTDLEGIGAELAYCKLFNLYPDTETTGHTPDEDAVHHTGQSVDVKATKYKSGHLVAVLGKAEHPAEHYCMMIGTFPHYRFAGYVHHEKLFRDENIKDLGHGPGYALGQDQLEGAI
mgnify:CR=1 FL=1